MKGWLLAGAAVLVLSHAAAAPKAAPSASFEVTGTVADAKGPLANKVVRVGPLDADGNMLRIRSLSGPNAGQSLNPQVTSDAQGRFAISVPRSMFRGLRDDQMGVGIYTDLGGGRMSSSHESATVRVDLKKSKLDVGRLVLEPLKRR